MDFTYEAYVELINLLKSKKYYFCNFLNYREHDKAVIFRHDIDFSMEKALEIAKLEHENNISSTFFVLLSTSFYNIFSKKSSEILKEIMNLGHHIGLHFDETRYEISDISDLEHWIGFESNILGALLNTEIKTISMHRPSKWILENNIEFKEVVNSYSKTFLSDFKYLADSRMHWREDVLSIIEGEEYQRLHILTHAFWYSDKKETISRKLMDFIDKSKAERYYHLKNNLRNIEEIVTEDYIIKSN